MNCRCYMLITKNKTAWYDTRNFCVFVAFLELSLSDLDEAGWWSRKVEGGKKEGSEILGCHTVLQYYRLEHNVIQWHRAKCAALYCHEEIVLGPLNVTFIGMSRVTSWGCDASAEPVCGQVRVIIQCRDLMQGSVRAESRIIAVIFLHNLDPKRLMACISQITPLRIGGNSHETIWITAK